MPGNQSIGPVWSEQPFDPEPPEDVCLWTFRSGGYCLSHDIVSEGRRHQWSSWVPLCSRHASLAIYDGWNRVQPAPSVE